MDATLLNNPAERRKAVRLRVRPDLQITEQRYEGKVYHVVKDRLPLEALYALRYHSFYPWHKEGEYDYLANDQDRAMLKWVRAFNRYDLYSKGDGRPDAKALRPYYEELVNEFFPDPLRW